MTVTSETGDGAVLTAIMQDSAAVLISQKKIELPDDDPLSQEKVRVLRVYQTLPGPYITSTKIDENGDIMTETRRQVLGPPNLVTTNNITAGVWTKTFGEPVGDSDYVSWEVVQVRNTQNPLNSYSIEIPDLIPVEFRSQLPVLEHSQTVIGTASAQVLGIGDLFHEQKQLDAYTYRETIRGRGAITLPQTVTNTELTEEYGGGVLKVTVTLDLFDNLTIDQGFLVVDSSIKKLDSITNGLTVKTSRINAADHWPTIDGRNWNEEFQTYDLIQTQVVDAATYVPPDPLPDFAVEEIRPVDVWRDRRIRRTVDPGNHDSLANALISYRYHPFQFPGTLDYHRLITFSHREGFRRAAALLAKHTIRTWWIDSATPPTVGNTDLGSFDIDVKEIISDTVNVPVFTTGSDLGAQSFSDVLHDDITNTLGAFYPATTPSFTEYYLGTSSGVTSLYYVAFPTVQGTGYAVGNTVGFGPATFVVAAVGAAGELLAVQAEGYPGPVAITAITNLGVFAGSGGGTGASATVFQVDYSIATPGTAWVGNERPIAADIKQTDVPNLWKIAIEFVVMR